MFKYLLITIGKITWSYNQTGMKFSGNADNDDVVTIFFFGILHLYLFAPWGQVDGIYSKFFYSS